MCNHGLITTTNALMNRSFVEAYNATLRVHDTLAQNRLKFAQRLIEMSDELINLAKEGERLRKVVSVDSSLP
jgi:hypothetical protein